MVLVALVMLAAGLCSSQRGIFLDPPRSRTTWILYHEGKAYIPCGYMTTWWGKIWKRWPIEAEKGYLRLYELAPRG